ncbi:MAG: arylsulfatase A-like enzyme, partial [Planctomycetota bacterium]
MIRHPGQLTAKHDKETLASAIDIAPTILRACGIEPPVAMSGLDLRDPSSLAQRNRVFVDVYQHDSDLSLLEDPNSGLVAKVVIDG